MLQATDGGIRTADVGPQRHLAVVDHGLGPGSSEASSQAAAAEHLRTAKGALTKRLPTGGRTMSPVMLLRVPTAELMMAALALASAPAAPSSLTQNNTSSKAAGGHSEARRSFAL